MVSYFLKGINLKKLTVTILGVFIYIWVTDFLIHGLILGSSYKASAGLWRTEEEMKHYFLVMLLGQWMIAKFFCILFVKGYEGQGWTEGARFGLWMGFYSMGPILIQYAVTPLPCHIMMAWLGLGLIQAIGGGIVASLIYGKGR